MVLKKKILIQILLRRWLRSKFNGLCILTFITIFLYLIYFIFVYLVFIKKHDEVIVTFENKTEKEDVILEDHMRFFSESSPSEGFYIRTTYNLSDRDTIRQYLNTMLQDNLNLERGSICEPHSLDKEEVEERVEKYIHKLVCSSLDWVKCYKSECQVVKDILETVENLTCVYRDVYYAANGGINLGNLIPVANNGTYVLKDSDYITINCSGHNLYGLFSTSWFGRALGIRKHNTQDEKKQNGSVNVLLLGLGCGTKSEFINKLPKTYKILTKTLNATVLNGFTSLGDDFTSTLFPILSGKNELEFFDVRKRLQPFKMPSGWFIFSLMKKYGYRTAFYEDSSSIFSRLNRFSTFPADHYNDPFLVHLYYNKKARPCLGDSSLYEIFMNLTEQFMYSSPKTFVLTFLSTACNKHAANVDAAVQKLLNSSLGDNTMVIVFGARGRSPKEPNNEPPFAAIIPPLKSAPDVQTAVQSNSKAVITPYDIYATLLDAVDLTEYWSKNKVETSEFFRGLSILRPIPLNRTCSDAAVPPERCTCHIEEYVTKTDSLYMTLAHAFVNYINTLTAPVRKRCAFHFLHTIKWMKRQRVNIKVITYAGSVDPDGYIPKFNPKLRNPKDFYRMQLVLGPSGAIFEAPVTYHNRNGKIIFDEKNIVRIDDNKTYCILPTHPELIKYCNCK